MGIALDKKAKIDSETRLRRAFEKYVPLTVINAAAQEAEPKLGGETKNVVCCFVDIRNFTNISTKLPPQILHDLLNRIFSTIEETATEYEGVIDKFIGDGALITWGAVPGSMPDSEKAITAAKTLVRRISDFSRDWSAKGLPEIQVGVGLHKGPVLVGNIGSKRRMDFTVIGSNVNLASRLEALTKTLNCNIVVSEDTTDLGKLSKDWHIKENVEIRGLDKPIKVAGFSLVTDDKKEKTA